MVQQLKFRKETLDNLDRVEPYGNTAAARAASETANMFARTSAQFTRMLGQESQKQAVDAAKRYAFETDPETGIPLLPDDAIRIGSRAANDMYQRTLNARYEDNVKVSLKAKLREAEIKHMYSEEGYRQEAALVVGAMADKVAPDFQAMFLDTASEINATTAGNIAWREAQQQRARASAAARRNVAGLTDRQILKNASPEDYSAALQTLLEDPNVQVLYEQDPEAVTKMLQDRIESIVIEKYRHKPDATPTAEDAAPVRPQARPEEGGDTPPVSETEEVTPAAAPVTPTNVEQQVQVTNETGRTHATNLLLDTKTQQRNSLELVQRMSMPQAEFEAWAAGATKSDTNTMWSQGVVDDNGFNGSQHAFWTNPKNLTPGAWTGNQEKLFTAAENGFIPSAAGDVLNMGVSGTASMASIAGAMNVWQMTGNDIDREGTWASKNPDKAGALDAVYELYSADYIQWESEEAKLEALNARAISALETSNEDLAKVFEMEEPEKVTQAQIVDHARQKIVEAADKTYLLGTIDRDSAEYEIDPWLTDELAGRYISYLRATGGKGGDEYLEKMIEQSTHYFGDGFRGTSGKTVARVPRQDSPYHRIPMTDGDSHEYLQDVAERAVKLYLDVDVDGGSDISFQADKDGYTVYVHGVETALHLSNADLVGLYDTEIKEYRANAPAEIAALNEQRQTLIDERDQLWKKKWSDLGNFTPDMAERDMEVRTMITKIDAEIRGIKQTGEYSIFGTGDNGVIRALPDEKFVRFIQ